MNPADCSHPALKFGSGDYYIFCSYCTASWVRRPNDGSSDQPDPNSANLGPRNQLSGEIRKTV